MIRNKQKQFFGEDGFHSFLGTVEDTLDPEKLGRVRVRVYGLHIQSKKFIPTSDLPWAVTLSPVHSASIDGIGTAPVGLLNGSIVFGFWLDGEDMQHPAILGSLPGVPVAKPNGKVGFNDPDELFPCDLDTPDVNIAARGVSGKFSGEHKATEWRKANVLAGATCDGGWLEPTSPAAPVYPDNSVREFKYKFCEGEEYGHVEEFDSTPGLERYCRHHKTSNNFVETHPDGTEVRKLSGPHFELNLMDKTLLVKGNWKIEVEGNKTEYIHGNLCQLVDGYKKVTVGSYFSETIAAYKQINIGAYRLENIAAFRTENIAGIDTLNVGISRLTNIVVSRTTNIGAIDTLTIGGARFQTIGGLRLTNIGVNDTTNILGFRTTDVGFDDTHIVGLDRDVLIGNDDNLLVNEDKDTLVMGDYYISAENYHEDIVDSSRASAESYTEQIGGSITMTSGGANTINASTFVVNASPIRLNGIVIAEEIRVI